MTEKEVAHKPASVSIPPGQRSWRGAFWALLGAYLLWLAVLGYWVVFGTTRFE